MPKRRFPPPWIVEDIGAAFVVQDSAGMRLAYCRGGTGVRDDGGAIGARDDGGSVGLRAGATDGCAGGSGIFAIRADFGWVELGFPGRFG